MLYIYKVHVMWCDRKLSSIRAAVNTVTTAAAGAKQFLGAHVDTDNTEQKILIGYIG